MKSTSLAASIIAIFIASAVHAESIDVSAKVHDYVSEKDLTIEAELRLPDEPVWPVAFVLHGCDGITNFSRRVLETRASFYRARGFATIILDSWRPRRISAVCDPASEDTLRYLDATNRVMDIEAVTAEIAELDGFDGRIVVDGLSHGAWTALSILSSPGDEPIRATVAGVVAWYPPCGIIDPSHRTPTLMFAGGKDAHPAARPRECIADAERYDWVETVFFENATHAFDYGYTGPAGPSGVIRDDPRAVREAYERLDSWLKEQGIVAP